MKLKLTDRYTLWDLRKWVKAYGPARIEMTEKQINWYKTLLRQRVRVPKMTYLGIPVELYEPERQTR